MRTRRSRSYVAGGTIGPDGNLYFYWLDGDGNYIREVVDTLANL
jgi:hypothetical protein